MYNVDPAWRYHQQMLHNAVEGADVKSRLLTCLNLLLTSHNQNVKDRNSKYAELVWWDPEKNPVPPPGWIYDPVRGWIKEGLQSVEGIEEENNG